MNAIRTKRAFYASDVEYQTIKAYARAKGRTVSDFVRYAALAEIKKHIPREGLEDVLKPIVLKIVQEFPEDDFPTRGIAVQGKSSGGR